MPKLLLIGPQKNKYDSTDTGGITILFELLISELKQKKVNFTVIDTLKANYNNSFFMFPNIILALLKNIKQHEHISLHATINSFLVLTPILIILAKIFGKTISLRKFAGSFDSIYANAGFFKKYLIKLILKNLDIVFFETKYLVKEFKKYNPNTYWFPNVRDATMQIKKERNFNKKFVYIGSINQEKGIDELCEVINQLDESYVCDIYGPIKFKKEKYSIQYFKEKGVNYQGTLSSNEVLKVMDNYDVLILPSHREGYPGIIIEAFALGIPVIATKLSGIIEMCADKKNSLLVKPKDTEELLIAIKSINQKKYLELQKEASVAFKNFNSSTQTTSYLKKINILL